MAAYDVVVVGAGSAGCAVVNRLCRSSDLSVCLIEAGPDYGPLASGQWPPELLDCHRMPSTHDWGYRAQEADGSTVPEPRAKVIGGCSAHTPAEPPGASPLITMPGRKLATRGGAMPSWLP
jgi:choline dehydrogenase